ncbi:MAG: phosphatase, partial [Actinobacteria bacterium]|nr:phosphatase [Actinomycetota bacterium]
EGRAAPGASARLGVEELVGQLQVLIGERMSRSDLAPTLLAQAERCNGGPLTDDVAVLLVGTSGWWC